MGLLYLLPYLSQTAVSASIYNETFSHLTNNIEHYYDIPVIHQLYENFSTKQISSKANPELYCSVALIGLSLSLYVFQ
jgi:hypothetical protein